MSSSLYSKPHNYLLIATYFPPFQDSGTYRTVRFVKYLTHYGWVPSVLAPHNLPLHKMDPSLLEDIPEEVRLRKVPFLHPSWQGLLGLINPKYAAQRLNSINQQGQDDPQSLRADKTNKRNGHASSFSDVLVPDSYLLFVFPALVKGFQVIRREKIELIYTTGSPHSNHLVGYVLKRLTGLPWVADFRDFWVDVDSLAGHWSWQKKINQWLEREVLVWADHVIGYSDGIARRLASKLKKVDRYKFTAITAGVDEEKFDRVLPCKVEGFSLAYIGRFNKLFPTQIFEAASIFYQSNRDFRFIIAGSIDPEISDSIEKYGNEGFLEILGGVSHDKAISIMKGVNILYLVLPETENFDWCVPGKLAEYVMSGNSIIANVPDGDTKNYLCSLEYAHITPYNVEALVQTLQLLKVKSSTNDRDFMPPVVARGSDFSADEQASRLAGIFESCIEKTFS